MAGDQLPEAENLQAFWSPYGAMLPVHLRKSKFISTTMFLFFRFDYRIKLEDPIGSATPEAGGIVFGNNGCKK
jgi:hypothetical protein